MKKAHKERVVSADTHEIKQVRMYESYRIERIVQIAHVSVGVVALIGLSVFYRLMSAQSVMPVYIGSIVLILHAVISVVIFASVKSMQMRLLRVLQYVSSIIDVVMISMVLWLFGVPNAFKSNIFQVYFLFVVIASFRYSRSLTMFTGLLAIVVYLGMFGISVLQETITLGTLSDEYTSSAVSVVSVVIKTMVLLMVSLVLTATAGRYAQLIARVVGFTRASQEQKQYAKDMQIVLRRYFTEDVADHIWHNRQKLFNERKEVTVMFCDFRNFTEFTTQLPTEHVVAILNSYLSEMVALVFKYNGTLDKYTGDGFMAIFGAPLSKGNDPYNALCVAVEVEHCVRELNKRYKTTIPDGLHVRIGISTGEAIVGNIGSEQRTEYTVIGEPVNLASRLEALNKSLRTTILLSETTYKSAADLVSVKYHGHFEIRGVREPVRVFELLEVPQVSIGEMEPLPEA